MSAKRAARGVKPENDAYGQEIWNRYLGNTNFEIIERDDGHIDSGNANLYFLEYKDWPSAERTAIRHARGIALDVGCGAGRAALYLQKKGLKVLAIDNSPLAVKVAKLRGVKSARVVPIQNISTLRGPFDTIVMFGNNFGLFGGKQMARRLLRAMHRITSPGALIIAGATDPYTTTDPIHLAYLRRNRLRGRMSGQLRLRVRYRMTRGNWFDYLFASQEEVRALTARTGWEVREIVPSPGPGYVVILKKI